MRRLFSHYPRALRRFLLGYLLLHLLAAVLFAWVITSIARKRMMTASKEKMNGMALMLREHLSETDFVQPKLAEYVTRLGEETGYRFTLIDDRGNVVCDSKTGTKDIGLHGDREEIVEAERTGQGFAERESATLKMPMMYFAMRASDAKAGTEPSPSVQSETDQGTSFKNGFVRVAIPSVSINSAIGSLQKYVWLFTLLMGALTGLLMLFFSTKTLQPLGMFADAARKIGDGRYEDLPKIGSRDDEWGELSSAFQQMRSELTRRERHLRESNQRMEAVLSSMIEGVFSMDPEGTVRMANRAACEILDLEYRNLVGKKFIEVFRQPQLAESVDLVRREKTLSKTEFETLTEPRRIISAHVSNMGNKDEPPIAVVLHDITELRQLETMRSDFVANVSHELKTPLASIKAYAETLRLGAINDTKKNIDFLEQIENSADLLNQQVLDLLQLARIESKQANIDIKSIDANAVCRSCVESLQPLARKSGIELYFELTQENISVRADQNAIETILNNLISNALHYTPDDGSVVVGAFIQDRWGILEVRDTGIGISPENQSRIFERFYRIDKARSKEVGGTGLGLAIVKHLTLALGGHIRLESSIGKGSTFEVHLPLDL